VSDEITGRDGLTEYARHENDGPQNGGPENTGREIVGLFCVQYHRSFFRSNRRLTVHITELKLEFKTS